MTIPLLGNLLITGFDTPAAIPVVVGIALFSVVAVALFLPNSRVSAALSANHEVETHWFKLKTTTTGLLFLVGAVLVASGVVYSLFSARTSELQNQIATLTGENRNLEEDLQKSKLFTVQAYFRLPKGIDVSTLDLGSIRCRYRVVGAIGGGPGGTDWKSQSAGDGKSENDVSCLIEDITRNEVISEVQIVLLQSNSRPRVLGSTRNISPLEPTYDVQ